MADQQLPELLYRLAPEEAQRARVGDFQRWLATERDLNLPSYVELHAWSVSELESFWDAVWHYFAVKAYTPYEKVLARADYAGHTLVPGRHSELRSALLRRARRCRYDCRDRVLADAAARAADLR